MRELHNSLWVLGLTIPLCLLVSACNSDECSAPGSSWCEGDNVRVLCVATGDHLDPFNREERTPCSSRFGCFDLPNPRRASRVAACGLLEKDCTTVEETVEEFCWDGLLMKCIGTNPHPVFSSRCWNGCEVSDEGLSVCRASEPPAMSMEPAGSDALGDDSMGVDAGTDAAVGAVSSQE